MLIWLLKFGSHHQGDASDETDYKGTNFMVISWSGIELSERSDFGYKKEVARV
jgi:hypothetical protein